MELVSVLANVRCTDEIEVINKYTYRQVVHIAGAYFKDRMMVVTALLAPLKDKKTPGRKRRPAPAASNVRDRGSVSKGKLVIDLDGPLEKMVGFVGGVDKVIAEQKARLNDGKQG